MDVNYFLKKRTQFIRFYYDSAAKPFIDTKDAIEHQQAPFDNPPYSEDAEPPFMNEWMEADTALKVLGLSCIALLSDSLKLYLHALETRVICFRFHERKQAFQQGFVRAYIGVLQQILDTDWSDCPANLDVIEQIVLARNRGQHAGTVVDFVVNHDHTMLKKYPNPFFANEEELKSLDPSTAATATFLMPTIEVTREKVYGALEEVEKLADYIEGRLHRAFEWRTRNG